MIKINELKMKYPNVNGHYTSTQVVNNNSNMNHVNGSNEYRKSTWDEGAYI